MALSPSSSHCRAIGSCPRRPRQPPSPRSQVTASVARAAPPTAPSPCLTLGAGGDHGLGEQGGCGRGGGRARGDCGRGSRGHAEPQHVVGADRAGLGRSGPTLSFTKLRCGALLNSSRVPRSHGAQTRLRVWTSAPHEKGLTWKGDGRRLRSGLGRVPTILKLPSQRGEARLGRELEGRRRCYLAAALRVTGSCAGRTPPPARAPVAPPPVKELGPATRALRLHWRDRHP